MKCAGKSWLLIPSLEQKRALLREERKGKRSLKLEQKYKVFISQLTNGQFQIATTFSRGQRTEEQIEKREKKTGGIETDMSSIEVAIKEFSVLFLYSVYSQSHSRINSSSSITPFTQLSRRKVLASLKVDIFVWERNIAIAVPSENCLLLSILVLAGTTGLDLVFFIHPRRRPSSPPSYLKVPINNYWLSKIS